jgi:hypothetical protein
MRLKYIPLTILLSFGGPAFALDSSLGRLNFGWQCSGNGAWRADFYRSA